MNKRLLAIAALGVLALTGCGDSAPPSADDPRDGRVTLAYSECAFGSCVYDWEICIGPDLLMHIGGDEHIVRNSIECEPTR